MPEEGFNAPYTPCAPLCVPYRGRILKKLSPFAITCLVIYMTEYLIYLIKGVQM